MVWKGVVMDTNKVILALFPVICTVIGNRNEAMDQARHLGRLIADHGLGDERSPSYDYRSPMWTRKFWVDKGNVFYQEGRERRIIGKI
jgi:hypothetical protein